MERKKDGNGKKPTQYLIFIFYRIKLFQNIYKIWIHPAGKISSHICLIKKERKRELTPESYPTSISYQCRKFDNMFTSFGVWSPCASLFLTIVLFHPLQLLTTNNESLSSYSSFSSGFDGFKLALALATNAGSGSCLSEGSFIAMHI